MLMYSVTQITLCDHEQLSQHNVVRVIAWYNLARIKHSQLRKIARLVQHMSEDLRERTSAVRFCPKVPV